VVEEVEAPEKGVEFEKVPDIVDFLERVFRGWCYYDALRDRLEALLKG